MTAGASPNAADRTWRPFLFIYLGLTTLIWLVFSQTLQHQFVAYDDQNYVYQNPVVTGGLTANGIRTAFSQPHARNWHPLTTLSHMLDCQLFGLNPAGHHFMSVLLHTCAALLLFSVLRRMTGSTWRSAFVAAVFAVHPLRVESVAWIAERKDVLSAALFMVALALYASYVARPTGWRYAALVVAFALGLMAKPMLVTLPLLLLLLDYWPLRRFQSLRPGSEAKRGHARLIFEKLPLLFLSVAAGVATLIAQKSTVGYGEQTPLLARLGNASTACLTYLWQMFWPVKLAVFYPHPTGGSSLGALFALAVLVLISAVVICLRKTRPYLVVGWFWYLIAVSPTLGLIPVGIQAHADRYTYLPHIGLYIALAWLTGDLLARSAASKRLWAWAAPVVLVALAWLAWLQTSSWRNTETLWEHALAVTPNNDVAHYNLALLAMDRGRIDGAIRHFEAALAGSGGGETSSHLSAALVHNNLGIALARKGLEEEAMAHYRKAVELRDDFADAHTNLATLLLAKGATTEAIQHFRKALSLPPEDAQSHLRLAKALEQSGETEEARQEYRRALALTTDPDLVRTLKKAIESER